MNRKTVSPNWPVTSWLLPTCLGLTLSLGGVSARLIAQDAPADAAAAAPAAAAPGGAAPAAAAPAGTAAAPVIPDDPAVRVVIQSNPQTPRDLLEATSLLNRLGYPELAKPYLARLIAARPDPATLAQLVDDYGSSMFLRLATSPVLQPEGKQFSDLATTTADRYNRDPARLQSLIAKLDDPSSESLRQTIVQLRAGQSDAVLALLNTLANREQAKLHRAARTALVELDLDTVGPALATLQSTDAALVAQVANVLGRIGVEAAVAPLAGLSVGSPSSEARAAATAALQTMTGRKPTLQSTISLLSRRVAEHYAGQAPIESGPDGLTPRWQWDAKTAQPVLHRLRADIASLAEAAQLSGVLYAIAPDARHRRWYLASNLELASHLAGVDNPDPKALAPILDEARTLGADAVEDALIFAIESGHPIAAAAAARVLGEIAKPDILLRSVTKPAPLVAAVQHRDRRVQFAAIEAVLKLNPTREYAGSSFVSTGLGYFASSWGIRKALVGHPNLQIATRLAGMLGSLGFETDVATNGRDLYALSTRTPDYEFVLISGMIDNNTVETTLAQIQQDTYSAHLPIAILMEVDSARWQERLGVAHRRTLVVPRPVDAEAMSRLSLNLVAQTPRDPISAELRLRQASQALAWLESIGSGKYPFYELRRVQPALFAAVRHGELAPAATRVLGYIPSPEAQLTLVDLASDTAAPIKLRQLAAASFGVSVRRMGVRLTSEELLRQYARYNRSETLDADTQAVLGAVLDWIELPSQTEKNFR